MNYRLTELKVLLFLLLLFAVKPPLLFRPS